MRHVLTLMTKLSTVVLISFSACATGIRINRPHKPSCRSLSWLRDAHHRVAAKHMICVPGPGICKQAAMKIIARYALELPDSRPSVNYRW